MNFPKSLLLGALTSFLGLILLCEIFLRLTVPTGFWYRHLDLTADLTSMAEARDRLRYSAPGSSEVLVLGDSVLGASALMEHRLPQARIQTLGRFLNREMNSQGLSTVVLAADGILLPDLLALSREFLPGKSAPGVPQPKKILLLLNFRMFAKDFDSGAKALSRDFLSENLPPAILSGLGTDPKKTDENRLSDRLYDFLCRHCFLFRETQMMKTLWYYPSQKDFFQRQLEKVMGLPKEGADLAEASLKLKIAAYYQAYLWPEKGLSFQSLDLLLETLKGSHIPVEVVLTPQNPSFLGDYLDRPSFAANRKTLQRFMKAHAFDGLEYRDWSGRYEPGLFLDHCHLTPEGNRVYATDLAAILMGKGKS
jgi:hypothetical protein